MKYVRDSDNIKVRFIGNTTFVNLLLKNVLQDKFPTLKTTK